MNRRATSFRRNIAAAHIAGSLTHEILTYVKSGIFAFRDITQRAVIIPYRLFGTTYVYILKGQEMEEIVLVFLGP
jgi:hypothetical protein